MSVCAYDKIVRNIITQANLFTDFSVRDCNKKQENYEQGWLSHSTYRSHTRKHKSTTYREILYISFSGRQQKDYVRRPKLESN